MTAPFFQPKLTVNQPGDEFEQEADAVADKVMRMSDAGAESNFFSASPVYVQRKCQHCEEEEKRMQRKESAAGTQHAPSETGNYVSSLNGKGRTLSQSERAFFEPRFGYDFSSVRLHTDDAADHSAKQVNALAYTYSNNIVFRSSQYQPGTDDGKRLMAHELTHVVQQSNGNSNNIQRRLGAHTHCPPSVAGAPAQPLPEIQAANDRAVLMSLGASLLLFSESLFIQDATFGPSNVFGFYRRRFGDPTPAPHNKFRNRFNGTLHNTLLLAQASELQYLSARLEHISHFLEGNIHFKCTGNAHTTIGSCTHHCNPGDVLASCSAGHGNTIAICAGFWGVGGTDPEAIGMIHEVSHMLYHYGDHDAAPFAQTSAQRRTEPECYASLVADIYGIAPFDPSCPII